MRACATSTAKIVENTSTNDAVARRQLAERRLKADCRYRPSELLQILNRADIFESAAEREPQIGASTALCGVRQERIAFSKAIRCHDFFNAKGVQFWLSQKVLQGGYYCCDQERHEFGDVLEGVEVEDGLLDGGLAVYGDHGTS